jgi:hypothetical protein
MCKKNILFLFLIFFCVNNNYAQEIDSKKHVSKIHKIYEKELYLNKSQSKVFKKVLSKYNPKLKKLIDTKASRAEINKLTKLEVLEIYDLLTSEQFKKYKEVRKLLEKNKHYRK